MATMFVKPADGLKVRFPKNPARVLPADGAEVEVSPYWVRRLKEESIVKCSPASARQSKGAGASSISDKEA